LGKIGNPIPDIVPLNCLVVGGGPLGLRLAIELQLGKEATGTQRFDALFGCDGGQSKVRVSQVEWLGEPKTTLYKKMFGIVSNLRKASRAPN